MELQQEHPTEWEVFECPIQLLKYGAEFPTLRELARATNERHSENMYIEIPLFDHMHGMRQECDILVREGGDRQPPSGSEVPHAYDGGPHGRA